MEQIYEIAEGNVLLHTGMPILGVSEIQVKCKENSHGKIIVKGIFAPDSHEKVLEKDWTGAPIVLINKEILRVWFVKCREACSPLCYMELITR